MRNGGRYRGKVRGLGAFALGMMATLVVADEPVRPPAVLPPPARIEDFAPPEEFVTAGGVKTHFVTRGKVGTPVVLVHGFGSSTYSWNANMEALSRSHRVYALDIKGFGLTAKPRDGQYNLAEYTRHLLAFLDVMKLEKPVLVGHSMGGAVVTRLALLHPERVRALVLVDPAPVAFGREEAEKAEKKPEAGPPRNNLGSRMLSAVLRTVITRERVEAGLKSAYHDPSKVTQAMVEHTYRPFTIEGAPEALAAMTASMNRDEPKLPPLKTLAMPVLLVWGRHDRVVPTALFDLYVKTIPNVQTAMFENSAHLPHEEEPDAFNARLLAFLDSLPGSNTTQKSK